MRGWGSVQVSQGGRFLGGQGGRGACLFGCLLTLPFRNPQGELAFLVACYPCLQFTFSPPSPRPPSRREGGESRLFHARGSAPCIPGAEPEGAPEQGSKPRAQRGLVLGGAGAGVLAVRKGGLPFWSPADFAVSESAGGLAFLVACYPCL